ncbi:hypothetical protein [Rubrivirga sp.]|uniref:hypothetical protein n=1 Tax=Rubrivirga sp. TaxID=1885344 RepID=UPI003C7620E9
MKRLLLLLWVALAACEAPLVPIAPSDLAYSLSGYLDASADTQWVRVEPFGISAVAVADLEGELPADVFLGLPDGSRVPMTQDVRSFVTGPAHLFWTTEDVAPGRAYRIEVEGHDGDRAVATVEVPDVDALDIELVDGVIHCPTAVLVGGVEFLVDVQSRYTDPRTGQSFRFSKAESFTEVLSGSTRASIYFGDDAALMDVPLLPWQAGVSMEVFVAVGTDDWLTPSELSLEGALSHAGLGRIEGGVGFVGGVVTRRFPFVPGVGKFPTPYTDEPFEPCLAP